MSDSSSDTSVGSCLYQSDEEAMTYVMVGEDTNTGSGDTCTRHSNDSNTVGLEEQYNKPSLDGAGCSTDIPQGTLVRLEEENIQLKKKLESFNRLSLASVDSGFHSETSSLASWGRDPITHRRNQDTEDPLGMIKDNLKRVCNPKAPKQKVTENTLHADTDLHLACKKGDLDRLTCILSESLVNLNIRGQYGRTPLMMAAEKGHRQVIDLLVTQGADVSLVDYDRNDILHVACLGGHVDLVKYVLSKKVADINSRGHNGRTPLMKAAQKGHRQVFDLLVTQGADEFLVDENRNDILHFACLGGHVDMVKYVLSQEVADINSRGHNGRTPLMVAAEKGHRQVFDLLMREGADVSLVDYDRNNILHVACLGGHTDMVNYVLSQKVADINSRGKYRRTPLMKTAEKGHRQVFDLLVREGADTSLADENRNNILHVSCLGGHVDMVKYVLSQKVADINSRGKYWRTPLMMAVGAGHRQVFDLLMTQGVDVSLVDDNRNNILHVACRGGHVDMVEYFLSQKVADINSRGQYGRTPLMATAEKGHRQVFDLLVTEGADVCLVDDNRNNILHVACLGGHVDMVKYILSQKVADINSRGKYWGTPLMKTAQKGHKQVFDLLVGEGADVSLVDKNRNNILHVACLGGHVDMVKYVLSKKVADINSRGHNGRTPLMVAAEKRHRQVFDLLVREGADVS
ncbi:ankyrin repeat domain-containing protein 50-like isoform X5 [Haliotis rufescens]|uniref:ankyrin repeat domain-containing protein 50-like isoform X5 n=1 Tax=Haliotis rufescens TaxID=6454 RepID=UPI00201EDA61|nr:ankyrin repeat domain-containing protein 50-like isoform X5 [Haliotis rufescens]